MNKNKDKDEIRKRETCESLRLLVFGAVGNEGMRPSDKRIHWMFEEGRGTVEEVQKLAKLWFQIDDDNSGDIDFSEFVDFFAKCKADRLLCMRCAKSLLGQDARGILEGGHISKSASAAKCTREAMMRMIWLKATEEDISLMNQIFDVYKIMLDRVTTPPLISKKKRRQLLENFNYLDTEKHGIIKYQDMWDGGLVDEPMMNELRAKYDRTGRGTINQDEFLEMLCPFGRRAHERVAEMHISEEEVIQKVYIDCGELDEHEDFSGWLLGEHVQMLLATSHLPISFAPLNKPALESAESRVVQT